MEFDNKLLFRHHSLFEFKATFSLVGDRFRLLGKLHWLEIILLHRMVEKRGHRNCFRKG